MIKNVAWGLGFGVAGLAIYNGLNIGQGIAGAAKMNGIPYYDDISTLENKTLYGNFAKSTFGGDNLLLNLAADIGGGWLGKTMQHSALEKAIVGREAQARGFHYNESTGGFVKGNRGIDYDRMKKVASQPNSRSPFPAGDTRSSQLFEELKVAKASKSPEGINKLYKQFQQHRGTALPTALADEVEAGWKLGKNIGRMSKVAAWAPLAFMAFDMVGSLSNLPSKSYPYVPRRAAGLSGTFMDTGIAATQRKRSLQAIHNSQYGGRSAFGNEASFYHQ